MTAIVARQLIVTAPRHAVHKTFIDCIFHKPAKTQPGNTPRVSPLFSEKGGANALLTLREGQKTAS